MFVLTSSLLLCVCVCVCACGDDVKTLLLDTALIGYCMSWMMYDTVDLLVMEVMSCHVMSCLVVIAIVID